MEEIEKQFGNDLNRFAKFYPKEVEHLHPINLEDTGIDLSKIYIMDKESCVIWKASSMIGYRDGILIMHER
jgi:hypothetical protein